MKLLLIEDDMGIAAMITRGLESEGYEVTVARDGVTGLATALHSSFGVVILDLMLPGMDGFQICESLRQRRKNVPILMLTARGQVCDRVKGLLSGADDYLAKPFDFSELSARIIALRRRDKSNRGAVITIDRLTIDTTFKQVHVAGCAVAMTPREYTLLEALARNEGRVLTRDVILGSVWLDDESCSNTVEARILSLRRKVDEGHDPKLIHTIHRMGYMLGIKEH